MLGNIVTRCTLHVTRDEAVHVEHATWNVQRLSGGPKPRRDAVDRQEQRHPGVFLPGAITPQQVDLLPAHLIEHGQAALEAATELWEAAGEGARSHEAPAHGRRAGVLVRPERGEPRAHPVRP